MNPLGKALLGLHAWGGMVFSWLLIPIFITGSIAVFEPEVSHWMRPEINAARISASSRSDALTLAETRLREVGADPPLWRITLPSRREPGIGIAWGSNPRKLHEETLDEITGEPVHVRPTEGGHFFTHFHAELLLGEPGRWIVGAIGIFMLAALVSGILIHHRFFSDFFTLRPKSGKRRSWLDVHNLIGVATLPFILVITYTGVVILAETFMPAATYALYDGNPRANRAEAVKSFERKASGIKANFLPLTEHLAAAERILGAGTVTSLVLRNPGDRAALVQAYRQVDDRLSAVADHVTFDAMDGSLFGQQTDWNPMVYAYRAQVGLHVGHFGGPVIHWLYFVSGLLGAGMMAAGTVLMLRKQRQRRGYSGLQRWLEAMGVTAISGTLLACVGLFAANRLIPAVAGHREALEITVFFTVWAVALAHAWGRKKSAWQEQFIGAGLICMALAVFDLFQGGSADVIRRGVDLTLGVSGLLMIFCGRRFFRTGVES